jgi:hypothetical protein
VLNDSCIGVSYSYRLDTADALAFIGQFGDTESVRVAAESADRRGPAKHEKANEGKAKGGKKSGKTGHGKRGTRHR